jgi:hypothetical protein
MADNISEQHIQWKSETEEHITYYPTTVWRLFKQNLSIVLTVNMAVRGHCTAVCMIHQEQIMSCTHQSKCKQCDMVKCPCSWCRICPKWTNKHVIQFPAAESCQSPKTNGNTKCYSRPSCHHQEKTFWDSHKEFHHIVHQHLFPHDLYCPKYVVLYALQGVAPSPIQPRLQFPCVRMPQESAKWRQLGWSDAVVPAVAGDPLAGPSMECLPQCLWDLHLTSSVTLSRTIPKLDSFEQPLYTQYMGKVG